MSELIIIIFLIVILIIFLFTKKEFLDPAVVDTLYVNNNLNVNNNLDISGNLRFKDQSGNPIGIRTFSMVWENKSKQITDPSGNSYNKDWIVTFVGDYGNLGPFTYFNNNTKLWHYRTSTSPSTSHILSFICYPIKMFEKVWINTRNIQPNNTNENPRLNVSPGSV